MIVANKVTESLLNARACGHFFINLTNCLTELSWAIAVIGYRLSKIQEPHPQPLPASEEGRKMIFSQMPTCLNAMVYLA